MTSRPLKRLLIANRGEIARRDDEAPERLDDAFVYKPIDHALIEERARRADHRRASVEGFEGVGALLDKRKPSWAE